MAHGGLAGLAHGSHRSLAPVGTSGPGRHHSSMKWKPFLVNSMLGSAWIMIPIQLGIPFETSWTTIKEVLRRVRASAKDPEIKFVFGKKLLAGVVSTKAPDALLPRRDRSAATASENAVLREILVAILCPALRNPNPSKEITTAAAMETVSLRQMLWNIFVPWNRTASPQGRPHRIRRTMSCTGPSIFACASVHSPRFLRISRR